MHFKRLALIICIGALPFVNAHAGEFTYNAQATVQAAYLWRGLYAGGANVQVDASVGYYGVYADMWWNIGASDMTFSKFQPEVDLSIGFKRWGLNVYVVWIHNFDCPFFDFANYPDKGNRVELNAYYTISERIPLTFHWATRFAGADSYTVERMTEDGVLHKDTVRAYSSYAEISYLQRLPEGFSLYGSIGVSPWKSGLYNIRGAALQNIELRLRKDWNIHERLGLMVQGQVAVNPFAAVHAINANIGVGVYLR